VHERFRNRLVVGERGLGDLADEQRRIGAVRRNARTRSLISSREPSDLPEMLK
jgi:hypothetical protein